MARTVRLYCDCRRNQESVREGSLSTGHGTVTSYVYLQPTGGGSFTQATVTSVNPYAVAFTVPSLSNGTYNVYVHNGHGGTWGWSSPLVLTIATPFSRGITSITVPASGIDDTATLNTAITTESGLSNGGTVVMNAGTYIIQGQLNLKAGVALKGAGSGSTIIQIALVSSGIQSAVSIQGSNTTIQGFTLTLINNGITMLPDFLLGSQSSTSTFSNVLWSDVSFTANDTGGAAENRGIFMATNGLEVASCLFSREFAPNNSDAWIHDSTFFGGEYTVIGGGSDAAIQIQALQRVVLEGNTFGPHSYPPSIGDSIVKRIFAGTAGVASVQYVYVANNTGSNIAPVGTENKGEMMLFHGGTGHWYGQVIANTGTTMTVRTDGLINGQMVTLNTGGYTGVLSDPLNTFPGTLPPSGAFGQVGMFASIVGGTGVGQLNQVTSVTSNTVTVTSPWTFPPDSTSIIVLGYVYKDVVTIVHLHGVSIKCQCGIKRIAANRL